MFSTPPNENDHFYVKRKDGRINVKVVRLVPSSLQGPVRIAVGGYGALQSQIGLLGGVCEGLSVVLLGQLFEAQGVVQCLSLSLCLLSLVPSLRRRESCSTTLK